MYLRVLGTKKFPENVAALLAASGGPIGGRETGALLELLPVGFNMFTYSRASVTRGQQ